MRLSLTTNAILLEDDERMLETLLKHDVQISVSLDGGREANDRHRKYANGKGSYDKVMQGLRAAAAAVRPPAATGLVLHRRRQRPAGGLRGAGLGRRTGRGVPSLPLGNWSEPPPSWVADGTAFADWLIPVFDRWYGTTPVPTTVRLFDGNHHGAGARRPRHFTEGTGLGTFRTLTVDTDGSRSNSSTPPRGPAEVSFSRAPRRPASTSSTTTSTPFFGVGPTFGAWPPASLVSAYLCPQTCRSCAVMEDLRRRADDAHRYRARAAGSSTLRLLRGPDQAHRPHPGQGHRRRRRQVGAGADAGGGSRTAGHALQRGDLVQEPLRRRSAPPPRVRRLVRSARSASGERQRLVQRLPPAVAVTS